MLTYKYLIFKRDLSFNPNYSPFNAVIDRAQQGKLNMLQHYELMVVFPGTMDEAKLAEAKQQVVTFITERAGTITAACDLPRRRLAYPINDQGYGYYVVRHFDMESKELVSLNKVLSLNQVKLRYLLIKTKPATSEQIQAYFTAALPKAEEKPVVSATPVAKIITEPTVEKPVVETSKVEEKKKDKTPVSIEELDKKLDAILDDTDIGLKL
ncbi:MAG: 30S ribosomal protein S6 [Patescibacteria group bacterium]